MMVMVEAWRTLKRREKGSGSEQMGIFGARWVRLNGNVESNDISVR